MKNKNKQTKFPVARIKKIMQKDEEVGKVAQATPIVISKALELFLAFLIEESTKVTTERGAKKVEAYHLKHAIETTEMLDFLKEIVETVPDPSAGGTIDLEAENAEGGKRRRGKGRKAAAVGGEGSGVGAGPAPKRRRRKKVEVEQQEGTNGMGEDVNQDQDATMRDREADEDDGVHRLRRKGEDDDDDDWDD